MRASISASASISWLRQASARPASAPDNWRIACARCASVSANTRSASPSTAVRSSRPLANARRVNSPASAGRKPGSLPSAASTAATTARPPCRCSSARSSAVSVFGPGNQSTSASSSSAPSWRRRRSAARRGSGSLPPSAVIASAARGPETRTTAIAAGGRPEERAKMVSLQRMPMDLARIRRERNRARSPASRPDLRPSTARAAFVQPESALVSNAA